MAIRNWALGVLLTALVSACATEGRPVVANASSSPIASDAILLSVKAVGGLCPNGECESTTIVHRDGHFSIRVGRDAPRNGQVPLEAVDRLAAEIARADFPRIKSVPFTGTCPVAYDGQELIYTFPTAAIGEQEIASCKVQIDTASPLFQAVEAVLSAANSRAYSSSSVPALSLR